MGLEEQAGMVVRGFRDTAKDGPFALSLMIEPTTPCR